MSPNNRARLDALFWKLASLAAWLSAALVLVVVVVVAEEAWPALSSLGVAALADGSGWEPSQGHYDLSPMIIGGGLAISLGIALSAPAGIGLAILCAFYAPPLVARLFRVLLGVLSGVPSVVVGLFGLSQLVPLLLHFRPPGLSLLAGALILALMTLPTTAALSLAALRQVPGEKLRAAYALGLSRRAVVLGVALPEAREALLGAVLLSVGRAVGEAMAVLMVMGNVSLVPKSLLDPARTLTMAIASEVDEATGMHRSALFAAALLLLVLVALLALLAPLRRRRA